MVYTVRNKCSKGYNFRVYFPGFKRYSDSGCVWTPAKGYSYHSLSYATTNWVVRAC